MKISAMALLATTTLLLLTLVVFATMDVAFTWVFYVSCIGQVLLIYTVYRVLKDDYDTEKTFSDFYEDYPIGNEENYE